MKRWVVLVAALLWAGQADSVLLAAADGTGNTSAPADDPGFSNVGALAGATAVHLGNGWVLTANHVGAGSPIFGGVAYPVVAGSTVQLRSPDSALADLRMFRVNPTPPQPPLRVYPSAPLPGTDVVMIGRGRDRGEPTIWNGIGGWLHAATSSMRWGTNRVSASSLDVLGTRAFEMSFSERRATTWEAQATTGDSGGAVFLQYGGAWYLAGILYAVGPFEGQPSDTALFGNASYAAQLSDYHAEVSALLESPVCSDGLDNDGDGRVDFPDDPGCAHATYALEDPACDNRVDDDGDGLVDLDDPSCSAGAWYDSESPAPVCGLGFEVALLLAPLARLRRVRSRRRRS